MRLLAWPTLRLIWRSPALRRSTIVCVALAILASGAEITAALSLMPILVSLGVDAGGELGGLVNRISPYGWLVLFAIAAGLRSVSNWLSAVQEQQAEQELVVTLQTRLYRALAGAHWDAVRHLAPPNITSALQNQTYEAGYGFSYLIQVITAGLLIVAYLISSAIVFPLVLPVLLGLLLVMWWINVRRNRRVNAISESYVDAHTELHQRYEDWVAISRISSLGVDTNRLASRFEAGARDAASHAVGYSRTSAATSVSYDVARVAAIVVGVPVAWWLDAPPALLAFALVALVRVLPQAGGIQTGYQGIINSVAPLLAVRRLIDELEKDQVQARSGCADIEWQTLQLADIGVEDVARENGQRWILRNVDLKLSHHECLVLTGPTGAGKTTLAELMLMLIRPGEGQLKIDDVVVDEELANRWRRQSAYVPQDVVLLDTSIRENLRLYVPEATDQELQAALDMAAADFVTTQLPEGLDTRAGPGGRWLSGGERQRIGIARALLRKPEFLVLDEPTAALDSETQIKLMDSLKGLKQQMSVVLITHRKELLALADRVINLDNGELQ